MSGESNGEHRSWLERLTHFISGEPEDREDLLELLKTAHKRKLIEQDALSMIEGVLQVSELRVRDITTPRSQMVVVPRDAEIETVFPLVAESAHSRYPVIGEDRTEVIGILLVKDLLLHGLRDRTQLVRDIMRPALYVPESKRLNVLLREFRATRSHMAIVVDEYGAAAGLVTITQTQPMAVLFAVPESYVPLIQRKLKAGQALAVQAWDRDLKEKLAEGQVTTTDNAIDLSTGTLKLKALLDNRNGALFPNQFANIRVQLDTLKDQLAVPVTAVQRGSVGTFVVVVQADGTAQIRTVELGAVDGDWQAVKGTLQAGERVVTDGADRLRDGSRVEVRNTVNPPLPSQSPMLGGVTMTKPENARVGPAKAGGEKSGAAPATGGKPASGAPPSVGASALPSGPGAGNAAGATGGRPPWMDRLPPEVVEKVKNMSPEERRAFFQKMREQRSGGAQ